MEEEPIDVMFDGVADFVTKSEQENHADDIESEGYAVRKSIATISLHSRSTEYNITDRPAVFQCTEDENELRYDVCCNANYGPDEIYDP